ncbi:hypothetical protein [Nocardia yamanashiensis]|uniref:hypothetical protein n=1 Tax=Nocardia yamanashiensis TaxID=209247 RepID=UPI0008344689|nr:hypothetical protein [Nocardia yamanashiensis]
MIGFVLDDTIIHAFAHGSDHVARMIAANDARSIRMAVPSVTLALAKVELSDEQCDEVDGVIELLEHIDLDGLHSATEATDFSRVIIEFGALHDLAAAHVVHTAKQLDWPIVTADRDRWTAIEQQLPYRLELFVLSENT